MEKHEDKDPRDQEAEASATDAPFTAAPTPDGADSPDELAARIGMLYEELHEQRLKLQDTEVALVARIADVDDDRRQAAMRLQRSLQAQREEIEDRLKHQASLVTIVLFLFLIAIGGALAFAYFQLQEVRESLTEEMARVQSELVERGAPETIASADPLTQQRLSQLSQAVEAISTSLERFDEEPAPPTVASTDRPDADAPAAASSAPDKADAGDADAPPVEEATAPTEGMDAAVDSTINTQPTVPAPAPEAAAEVEPETSEARVAETPVAADDAPAASSGSAEIEPQDQPEPQVQSPAGAPGVIPVGDKPFTVQLMGFFSLDSLVEFVREQPLPSQVFYQTTTYQGRPWYVLIHSRHPTQEEAAAAAAALPPELAKLDLWIRRLDADKTITALDNPSE